MAPSRAAICVLVRDPRYTAGGFETWVEQLAAGLPEHGVAVSVLVPGSADEVEVVHRRLAVAGIVRVEPSQDDLTQAGHLLAALASLAEAEQHGIFFTMAYPYINVAGLNLAGGPWCPVPVMHGRHPSAFNWICAGPARKVVVPSDDF